MPYKDPAKTRAKQREWKAEKIARMVAYLGGVCVECGTPDGLEFHHRDPAAKTFNFNQRWTKPWADLVIELDRCELRCHAHHMAVHEARHGTISRYLSPYHRCRCDLCSAAFREYDRLKHARYREERRRRAAGP